MNSLLQTFFIAILGVFLLSAPIEKSIPELSMDTAEEAQQTSTLLAKQGSIDHKNSSIDHQDYKVCTASEKHASHKQVKQVETSDEIKLSPALTRSLDKFFMLVGYLTGFEKLSSFFISQSN